MSEQDEDWSFLLMGYLLAFLMMVVPVIEDMSLMYVLGSVMSGLAMMGGITLAILESREKSW